MFFLIEGIIILHFEGIVTWHLKGFPNSNLHMNGSTSEGDTYQDHARKERGT